MSYPHSPTPGAHRSPPELPLPWEPALTQLRELAAPDLDALVTHWLGTLGLTGVRPRRRPGHTATYQAILGQAPFATPIHIRVYQRKNQLQAHHVDAFRGYLQRMGIPGGLLITTGGGSQEAILIAGATQSPQICLLSGEQWAALLADRRAGLKRSRLPRWIVDLARATRGLCRGKRNASGGRHG